MADEEDRRPRKSVHEIGAILDDLSVHEFDERIAALRAEIERLEAARAAKKAALDQAGSVFRS